MALYPLTLTIKEGNWQRYMQRKSDPSFMPVLEQVLERDNHTCQFCSFQASEFQQVVNLDHNYNNNTLDNMVTACVFCTQCCFVESVGKDEYGGGTLIYLPEMTQAQVNGMCHVLFCAITNGTNYKPSAQMIFRSMKLRAQIVEKKFGENSSNPAMFGQMVLDVQSVGTDTLAQVMGDLRLLPSRAKFKKQIEAWAQAAFAEGM